MIKWEYSCNRGKNIEDWLDPTTCSIFYEDPANCDWLI